ncbi:MAG: MBL fold metallo-hydrolase [Thermoplasmata archaeon]
MRIRWHGHSCFEVENDHVIITDPHDGKSIGIKTPNVEGEIILVSHDHFDHNATRIVKKSNSEVINEPGTYSFGGLKIQGLKTFHDEKEGEKRGENIIFKFTMDGTAFCHLGDLGHLPAEEVIDQIKGVDFLFIPVGGTFTIGPEKAAELVELIKPSIAIPMHYKVGGLSLNIKDAGPFLFHYPEERIHKVGVELEFLDCDIPEETEIWVFSL